MIKLRSFVIAALVACATALPCASALVNGLIPAPVAAQEAASVPVIGQEEPDLIEFDAEFPSHEDAPIVIPMTVVGSAPKAASKPVQFRQPVLQKFNGGLYGFAG